MDPFLPCLCCDCYNAAAAYIGASSGITCDMCGSDFNSDTGFLEALHEMLPGGRYSEGDKFACLALTQPALGAFVGVLHVQECVI